MIASQPILVIGGTRGTGLLIAQRLQRQRAAVRVLARNRDRAIRRLGPHVEVVSGDVTQRETLPRAIDAAAHIIFTAGCRSGHPAREARVKATEYDGVLNTLETARRAGFHGRFLYMTSSGVGTRSILSMCLNLYKGNTLVWRARAEDAIRASGVDYTVIRTGMLLNRAGGLRAIAVTQEALPLSIRHRIARADVAEVFVAALNHPRASRVTFDIVWGRGKRRDLSSVFFQSLEPDQIARSER